MEAITALNEGMIKFKGNMIFTSEKTPPKNRRPAVCKISLSSALVSCYNAYHTPFISAARRPAPMIFLT